MSKINFTEKQTGVHLALQCTFPLRQITNMSDKELWKQQSDNDSGPEKYLDTQGL